MATTNKKKGNATIMHCVIGMVIMILFRFLPISLPEVTPIGMEIIGIFLGTLYLWTFVDVVWSSLASIFMIGISSFAPMGQVLQQAFGNPTVVQMFFLLIIMGALVYNKLTIYIGRFFLTRKFSNGRPWVFTFVLMVGAFLMAAFVGPFAPIFLFWPVLYDIFSEIGMKKGEHYPTIMLILIGIATLLGFPVPPYSSNGLALISNFATLTTNMGQTVQINSASYLALAIIYGVICMLVIVLFCKFVLHPDVSALKNLDVQSLQKRNPLPPLNLRQKIMGITFIVYIASMLLPSIFPGNPVMAVLNQNLTGLAVGFAAFLCCVTIGGEPILPFNKIAGDLAWGTFFLCTAAILLGSVLTTESTGISAFLNVSLSPIFKHMSPAVFSVAVMIAAVLLTNVCNSLVIGMLLQPVIATYCMTSGSPAAPVTAMMIIFVLASAAITPAASPFAAMLHGNKDWLKTGAIYKYTTMFVIIEIILVLCVGIPLSNILL